MPRSRRPVTSLADAVALDAADPLSAKRELFELPAGIVYLDGNSLGALPKAVKARVAAVVADQWGQSLITSWNRHGWFTLASRVGDRIGRLVGAPAGTVICCDTISVNLFKLIAAATRLRPGRPVILSDSGNFPSDLYMAQGLAELTGAHRLVTVAPEEVADAIDETVALVLLTEVDYRSGRRHDMKVLTRRAHDCGALILWDLAHSAGALPVDLAGAGADFAVGCTYKFLNGGPGAPAFLYVRQELQNDVRSPLSGWWGHETPFAFDLDYRPAPGIARQQCGTQAILSMAALDTALDVFDDVDMTALRRRSVALCEALAEAVEANCGNHGVELIGPRKFSERGSHVSFRCPNGYAVMQVLIAAGVIGDFRAPDMIRFGIAPLYNGFGDVFRAAEMLATILDRKSWDAPQFLARAAVT